MYMNSANNLQPDSLLNVSQLAATGSDLNINIVMQWKQAQCSDCGAPSFFGTRRYFIHQHTASEVTAIRNGDTTSLDADRLADPPTNNPATHQSDMGDYRVLQDFAHWGAQNYPADHMAVLVWDHGSGWRPVNRSATNKRLSPRYRAVSQDNETNGEIETQEIPLALANLAQPIDMLIFDCSLEMMVEVAYEVRNTARVMVGSEESPPGNGYPYDRWINALKATGLNPCDVGNSIVTTFVAVYPTQSDITQSVIELSKMPPIAAALDTFGASLITHRNDQAALLQTARDSVQSYAYPDNKDLFSYAEIIRAGTTAPDLKSAAANLQSTLLGSSGVIIQSMHGSSNQTGSRGLAVYVPNQFNYLASYNDLALTHAAPRWAQFLQAQVQ